MGINLGDTFPDFTAKSTEGEISFHKFVGEGWAVLCSHPDDFTPVCTTELSELNNKVPEFRKLNCKVIGLSCNSVDSHNKWKADILSLSDKTTLDYPIIADEKRELAVKFGMLDPDEKNKDGLPLTCRAVFIIGPGHKLKLSILYPATCGRNFDEILRVLKSLQLTVNQKLATPVNWKPTEDCIITPAVQDKDIETLFPKLKHKTVNLPSGKEYLRFIQDPSTK